MRLEELFIKLKDNPSVMSEIEVEMKNYIDSKDLVATRELLASNIPEMKFYALKIVEYRIKNKKIAGVVPEDEINLMCDVVQVMKIDKAAQVFATLGIYEWPGNFPLFFSIIIDLLSHRNEMGYKILKNFLYLCNGSQEIDESRKNELKKGCSVMSSAYMSLFDESMAQHIIPILTESLRMMSSKDLDYGVVVRRGAEYPEETIEFLSDGIHVMDIKDVIDIASKMEISYGMIMCFNSLKNKAPKVQNLNMMYEYVFKGLRKDLFTFSASIEFWTKLFGQNGPSELVGEILTEVISIYLSIDDTQRCEVEGEVLGLFNVICKNYSSCVVDFICINGDYMSRKLVLYFLKKLFGSSESVIPSNLTFKDPVLCCALEMHRGDTSAMNYIQYFNLNEKEACKLIVRMMEMYPLSTAQLNQILNQCDVQDKSYANEVIVECLIRLGQEELFDGEWDHNKIMRLFFYLRKNPSKFLNLGPSYSKIFIEKAPFDRCFAILKMFGNIPDDILHKIYSDMDSYSFVDVGCFNRDLLGHLKNPGPFIQKEITRCVNEWKVSEDPEDLIGCVNSLILVMSYGINRAKESRGSYPYINELIEILQIDDPSVVKKISETFNVSSDSFDTRRAVYLFMTCYNSSIVESAHSSILSSLMICIKQEEGPKAFHEILGVDLQTCTNLRGDVLKSQTKRGQNLIRTFLQDYKGKPLNSLYADDFKVKGQNFLKNIPIKDVEFEIERSFFEDRIQ